MTLFLLLFLSADLLLLYNGKKQGKLTQPNVHRRLCLLFSCSFFWQKKVSQNQLKASYTQADFGLISDVQWYVAKWKKFVMIVSTIYSKTRKKAKEKMVMVKGKEKQPIVSKSAPILTPTSFLSGQSSCSSCSCSAFFAGSLLYKSAFKGDRKWRLWKATFFVNLT